MILFKLFRRFSEHSKKTSRTVLLHGMYYIGIGGTSCVAKLVGKHFLEFHPHHSAWKETKHDEHPELMYE